MKRLLLFFLFLTAGFLAGVVMRSRLPEAKRPEEARAPAALELPKRKTENVEREARSHRALVKDVPLSELRKALHGRLARMSPLNGAWENETSALAESLPEHEESLKEILEPERQKNRHFSGEIEIAGRGFEYFVDFMEEQEGVYSCWSGMRDMSDEFSGRSTRQCAAKPGKQGLRLLIYGQGSWRPAQEGFPYALAPLEVVLERWGGEGELHGIDVDDGVLKPLGKVYMREVEAQR